MWSVLTRLASNMKVVEIQVTPVTIPMIAPLRWSMGVEHGTTRAIIQARTDEGITGIGETYGGNAVEHAIEIAKPYVLGLDPLETAVDPGQVFFNSGTTIFPDQSDVSEVTRARVKAGQDSFCF